MYKIENKVLPLQMAEQKKKSSVSHLRVMKMIRKKRNYSNDFPFVTKSRSIKEKDAKTMKLMQSFRFL